MTSAKLGNTEWDKQALFAMARPTKALLPVKQEAEESQALEQGESTEEEQREGTEDGSASKTNRKRSPRGAKNTKAPMDAECSACKSGKTCSCNAKKDGGCGSYGKKMDRNDALTPHEYLTACELGIQGRSRPYIRARLDAAERLDLKCGNGSISEGEKCSKGSAQKVKDPLSVRSGIKTGAKIGSRVGAGVGALQGAALGATLGGPAGALAGAAAGALGGAFSGMVNGASIGGAYNAGRKTARAYSRSQENGRKAQAGIAKLNPKLKIQYEKAKAKGASREQLMQLNIKQAGQVGNELDKAQTKVWSANNEKMYKNGTPFERSKKGRRDSVYASGFTPDLEQLAI